MVLLAFYFLRPMKYFEVSFPQNTNLFVYVILNDNRWLVSCYFSVCYHGPHVMYLKT